MDLSRHVDAETIYALLDGELDGAPGRLAHAHLWRCPRCRALQDECAAVLTALRWYATAAPPSPAGYWDRFWRTWSATGRRRRIRPTIRRVRRAAPLAAAATVAALAGAWWAWIGAGPTASIVDPTPPAPPARAALVDSEWAREYEFFERVTVAVGSVDPLTKGIALAGFAEAP